ncbi:hypothetical protein GUJ93_ZPchr0001g32756 [Zizania palustris]|uniref:RING-type domain-containing protein n=1 Tax=Zizania palustris TaxID=103762 RepID=A0A8J5RK06_ZIZPA|nr:hypothetical protein GUJ93_ZPchr0001g32756 [Zizania palustris]
MGAHTKSMSWFMGPPSSASPGDTGEAQQALSSSGGSGGSDASFDTNMVIILAALLFALLFALGLNSLARFLIRWARSAASAGGDGEEGAAAGGLKKRALRSIPVEVYGSGGGVGAEVCAICLGEFADGEKVRVLPRCGHGFHVRCVDTWLVSRDSCPTCRRSVLNGATTKQPPAAAGSSRRAGSEAASAAVTLVIA